MSDITAVLLCGGRGERLRPFTDHAPKPLVPVAGKPILAHLMNFIASHGISRFVLCVGYKAECIRQFVDESIPAEWSVTCVDSGEDAAMAKRVADALPHVSGRALICYGDTLANVDIAELRRVHESAGTLATISVYPLQSHFGIVNLDSDDRVTEMVEKPLLPYWINIGFLLCEPEAFNVLDPNGDLVTFSSALAAPGRLRAYRHTGKHITINTEKDRVHAEGDIVDFFTYIGP